MVSCFNVSLRFSFCKQNGSFLVLLPKIIPYITESPDRLNQIFYDNDNVPLEMHKFIIGVYERVDQSLRRHICIYTCYLSY